MSLTAITVRGQIAAFVLALAACAAIGPFLLTHFRFAAGFFSLFIIFILVIATLPRTLFIHRLVIDPNAGQVLIKSYRIRGWHPKISSVPFSGIKRIRIWSDGEMFHYVRLEMAGGEKMFVKEGSIPKLRKFAAEIAAILQKHEIFRDNWE